MRRAMLLRLDAYRAGHGLPPLRYSKSLELAADEHARDMYERRFFAHQSPDGQGPPDRAMSAGFCHRQVGENISYGMNSRMSAGEALDGWKASPGHDRNMRDATYAYVGLGHHSVRVDGNVHNYWVQVFAQHVESGPRKP